MFLFTAYFSMSFNTLQAVIRVSKQYLPAMSTAFSSPRVRTYIGDGFAFLASATSQHTYDAIITDSSDPVGPAQALFEQPYFKLLHSALAPGGVISTQAECLWLHLPFIAELRNMARSIFETAEYSYTTIPTYPSGQIGFIVASNVKRDLTRPVHNITGTRYYNADVHRAAFVMPEFGRVMLDEGRNILPVLERKAEGETRRVLLLGSGYVARPAAEYILRDPRNELTIGESLIVPSTCVNAMLVQPAGHSLLQRTWPLRFLGALPSPSTPPHSLHSRPGSLGMR